MGWNDHCLDAGEEEKNEYTFREDELLAKLKEAHKAGYEPTIIINGETYDIEWR